MFLPLLWGEGRGEGQGQVQLSAEKSALDFRAFRLQTLESIKMARRLKVLISAYTCEPGKGSEPEVGWQWAMHLAASHDVTVLTRSNNRPAIENALAGLPPSDPRPIFVYH